VYICKNIFVTVSKVPFTIQYLALTSFSISDLVEKINILSFSILNSRNRNISQVKVIHRLSGILISSEVVCSAAGKDILLLCLIIVVQHQDIEFLNTYFRV